jgi:uncharacterized membrane protein YraQ (UPF0718 family)/regulator of protease activity HflC (stomatin/prohibitin superfamily)
MDAVLLTWRMLGPIMMIARLVATFFTALAAGVIAIVFPEPEDEAGRLEGPEAERLGGWEAGTPAEHATLPSAITCECCHSEEHAGDEADVVGVRGFGRSLRAYLGGRWRKTFRGKGPASKPMAGGDTGAPGATQSMAGGDTGAPGATQPMAGGETGAPSAAQPPSLSASQPAAEPLTPFPTILRRVARYGYVEMLDDLAFWFVFGLLLTGLISAFVPGDLASRGLGSGLLPMLLMFAAGIPLYMCASASIPVATALVLKGVSPGAAMVFLLSGPATNPPTLILLTRHFGRKFVRIYLVSVAAGSLVSGLLLDYFLSVTGWRVTALLAASSQGLLGVVEWLSAAALAVLLVWRLFKGAARQGLRDLVSNYRNLFGHPGADAETVRRTRRRRAWTAGALAAALYVGSGLFVVPPDSSGYEFLFGKYVARHLGPGLHYWAPAPIGRRDVWRTGYPRKSDVGFQTDLKLLAQRREVMKSANPEQWHSPVTAMNASKNETGYLTGDENLLDAAFTVHYTLSDPYAFFYRVGHSEDIVGRYAKTAAREFIARSTLDDLLTRDRARLEQFIAKDLQQHLDEIGAGVAIDTVHVVDIHPPQDAVFAFRDASSAREDRETRIFQAYETLARDVPKARGQATLDVARAQAAADTAVTIAAGKSEAFLAQARAFSGHANLIGYLLWLEMAERVLPGREKFIVPAGTAGRDVILWRDLPSLLPAAAPTILPPGAPPTPATGSPQLPPPTGAPKK